MCGTAHYGKLQPAAANHVKPLQPRTIAANRCRPRLTTPQERRGLDFAGKNGYTEKEEKQKNTAGCAAGRAPAAPRGEKSRASAAGGRAMASARREKERL